MFRRYTESRVFLICLCCDPSSLHLIVCLCILSIHKISAVGGDSGSHDCARDPRGFVVKFRTRKLHPSPILWTSLKPSHLSHPLSTCQLLNHKWLTVRIRKRRLDISSTIFISIFSEYPMVTLSSEKPVTRHCAYNREKKLPNVFPPESVRSRHSFHRHHT